MNGLVNIYLHGNLGTTFGEKWQLLVSSPAEAVRALDANTRGAFMRYIKKEGNDKKYKVYLNHDIDHSLGSDELQYRSGKNDIHILPVITGENSGVGKILAGVALLALAVVAYIYQPEFAAYLSSYGTGLLIGVSTSLGTSLVLGGISQLLAPNNKQPQQLNTATFQGSITAPNQGFPIPLCYGRVLCAPLPISIDFDNSMYSNTVTPAGSVTTTYLGGNGIQYSSNDSANGNSPVGISTVESAAPPSIFVQPWNVANGVVLNPIDVGSDD